MESREKQGILFAITAYGIWAFAPIYFKQVGSVPAFEILSHRVIWSLLLTMLIIIFTGRWPLLIATIKNTKTRLFLLASTTLIVVNWWVFIWAVNNNNLLSASLGYYINPLINILFGLLFFSEKLDRVKKIAAALCIAAVTFEVIQFGQLPWIALSLATSFALYGLVRKKLGVDSFIGMALETGLMLPIAIAYLIYTQSPSSNLFNNSVELNMLLLLAGPVTMIPLLCFAAAANRITMTSLGFFQYIGPSGMFLLAVFLYGEPISNEKLITFIIIWSALALLVWDSVRNIRPKKIGSAHDASGKV